MSLVPTLNRQSIYTNFKETLDEVDERSADKEGCFCRVQDTRRLGGQCFCGLVTEGVIRGASDEDMMDGFKPCDTFGILVSEASESRVRWVQLV